MHINVIAMSQETFLRSMFFQKKNNFEIFDDVIFSFFAYIPFPQKKFCFLLHFEV